MNSFPPLNFPNYSFHLFKKEGKVYVKDPIRKKNLLLTPEEWVRQHCIQFLHQELGYPNSTIGLEGKLTINQQTKRFDILAYQNSKPFILVECKAAQIKIDQNVFDQIARYNLELNVPFIWVTNGLKHFFATIDYQNQKYNFIKELPPFNRF